MDAGAVMKQLSSKDVSIELFRELLRIRMIEEAIADRYAAQKMRCPVHLSIGQEAVAVGVCRHLAREDYLISNHRAHAHFLAKGGSLPKMIAEIHGKVDGCCLGRGGSMHLIDLDVNVIGTTPIVAGSLPVGVGVAFGSVLKGEDRVTAIFFGEAATEEGVWAESINFASLKKLPILFVCENNLYSVYSPLSVRQAPERSRLEIARAHGIFSLHSDGNDVDVVADVTRQAMEALREGRGPVFVEFDTYRYREHCGPNVDDQAGYRPQDEVLYWHTRCPLKLYEQRLYRENLLDGAARVSMTTEITREINAAFTFAENSPFPIYNPHESVYA
jgi:pyruvate dehydrogenase E1 component alpha subunit